MFSSGVRSDRIEIEASEEACREPELRLMLAVLEEALMSFRRGVLSTDPMQRKDFFEVDAWVRCRDTDWPFSFENICSTLEIDPDYLRARLARLKRVALTTRTSLKRAKPRREGIYDRRSWRGQIG